MNDKLAETLSNNGPTNERQIFFQKSFLSNKQFVGVPYEKMPKQFREYLDTFAVTVLDTNSGKVIVTGSPLVGKSFLIQQLYFNRSVFMERAKIAKLEFVNVTLEHAMLVSQNAAGRWMDYVELAMNIYGLHLSDIIFVTESLDAAIGITSVGGRVVLETSPQTLHTLQQHESSGVVKQWNSWDMLDLNEIFLDKFSLIEILVQAHLDTLNTDYPEIHITKKHVALLVDYCIRESELLIDKEMSEHWAGRILVQPGIMARALFRFASTLAFDNDMRNSKGVPIYARAIKDTYANFEGIFFKCFQDFLELMDEDDDDAHDDAIRSFLENNMPGVQILQISNAAQRPRPGKEEEAAAQANAEEAKFSDFTTLEARLKKTVLGQDNAIAEVVNGLKISAAGLNSDLKPLRSLLFLGPTGVGKTQLSLSLAEELMDTKLPVKRIDMSEFGASHEASKLLGAPPGYVGHEAGGVLTNFVKEHPRSVVILDEIEKSHPKVWDSFLQVLDAGRLTDSHGDTIDFTKTIVIMTSNLGADKLKNASTGFSTTTHADAYLNRIADAKRIVKRAVEEEFRPEMVNRIDQIVIFNELPANILRKVIAKELEEAGTKLTLRGYTLVEPKVDILDHIAGLSDVSKYGAREVQRVVGTNVLELLADEILSNTDKKTLTLSLGANGLIVKSKVSKSNGASQA
jgi:DNA polymerase III delta prime subunit